MKTDHFNTFKKINDDDCNNGDKQKNESTKERKEGIKDSMSLFMVFAAIVGESFIKNKSIQIKKKNKVETQAWVSLFTVRE